MEMCSSRMINHNQQVISTSAMAACFVFWHPLVLVSGLIFAAGCYSFIVENTLNHWLAASVSCDLVGSEESLREEFSDGVPSDGRSYWVGAIQKSTKLFSLLGCNAYNDPKTLVFKQKILNSTQPVLDCYRACVAYRVFALSSYTCFCKNHSYSETDYSCTPVQFRPGSADFHGGSKGVVEYDKQINVTDINQDEVGDCVSCQQFTETCVNYRMTPCTTELSHKCDTGFVTDKAPWWDDSITSCDGLKRVVTSVPNRTAVWTRISRRSVVVWTNSLGPAVDALIVRCLSVAKINNTIHLIPQGCFKKLPSLCQGQRVELSQVGGVTAGLPSVSVTSPLPSATDGPNTKPEKDVPAQGKDKPPENAHVISTVTLVVVSALACLASLGFLGIAIYFRRQRNAERMRRLEETYVSPNFVQTETEAHQYASLQYIANSQK
uniref:Uncharacterized protein LOC111119992 isoform X1 n=1 Tax=Crassostrea virginica TaxID=6565 RepID=A0A8B8CKD9_CRAVI|nr:uncharacterized protein LOC111119992 isoform X1 [Crassostrea virginica]